MRDFIKNLGNEVDQKIRVIESREISALKKAIELIDVLKEALYRLKSFISGYRFPSEKEEIEFFKVTKPDLLRHLLYYRKVYNIEMNRPVGTAAEQVKYLGAELGAIQAYICKRLDFYRYVRSGATHCDREFFLRGNRNVDTQYLDSFYFERDPLFSTQGDFHVAKIYANDMLQNYLCCEMAVLEGKSFGDQHIPFKPADVPRWTDKKTGLIEIIYSLEALRSLDGGEIALRKIQSHFEVCFGVNLGNISRALAEMRIRNNQTPFLDSMKQALLDKMNEHETTNLRKT